jgi:hypothetical protein
MQMYWSVVEGLPDFAGFVGFLLDRTRAFKLVMRVSQTAVLAFAIALSAGFGGSAPSMQACLVCMGIMGFLILPTALEMSAEVAYPFSAELSAGLLWAGAHAASVAVGLAVDCALVDHGARRARFARGRWLLLACFGVACLMWWLFPVRCAHLRPRRSSHTSKHVCLCSFSTALLHIQLDARSVRATRRCASRT